MKFGLSVPNLGSYWDVRNIVTIARDAEEAGWDGFFLWDQMVGFAEWGQPPMCDPWIALGAVAMATERVRIGTMVTPVARRRPWKLARETATIDRLSGGRMTLGVGLGNPPDDFALLGEETDNRVRARKLDEGLEVLTGLWSGQPFSYEGEHFRVGEVRFRPQPVQRPRIPVWVAGQWPNQGPLRRAARYDGVYPVKADGYEPLSIDELSQIIGTVRAHRGSGEPFDVVLTGLTDTDGNLLNQDRSRRDAPTVAEYEDAGATWWLTEFHDLVGSFDEMRKLVQDGPPRI